MAAVRNNLPTKNVLLTGLMGTGKSTVGRLLAVELGRELIDTDQFIDKQYGPTSSILNQPDGDNRFRLIEEQVAIELSQRRDLVIATGGRFMVNQKNVDTMKRSASIFCLTAELDELVHRLLAANADTFRPRFDKANDKLALMKKLEQQSQPFYSQYVQVQTTARKPAEVVADIKHLLAK